MVLRISLITITALLLGAHFLRTGSFLLVALCLLTPLLFLYKRRLTLVLLQIVAYGASLTWLWTAYDKAQIRMAYGDDWQRMVIILSAVALFSLIAGLLLNSPGIRERYPS